MTTYDKRKTILSYILRSFVNRAPVKQRLKVVS